MKALWHLSVVGLALACVLVGCERSGSRADASELSTSQDPAVARELSASLSGDVSPGGQNYSFRGLYAGMTREHLESSLRDTATQCTRTEKPVTLVCHYDSVVEPDSAHLTIDATYLPDADTVATVVEIVRPLPLNIDGIRLVSGLADAFEKQTRLLDTKDQSFEGNHAELRMGTVSSGRQNFVNVVLAPKLGRQILTVTLRRMSPPRATK